MILKDADFGLVEPSYIVCTMRPPNGDVVLPLAPGRRYITF